MRFHISSAMHQNWERGETETCLVIYDKTQWCNRMDVNIPETLRTPFLGVELLPL